MYLIYVYIPLKSKEKVKEAMFLAGAGRIGNYEHCCFEYEGKGQFRPLKGSNPHIGEQEKLEIVEEVKVEFICPFELVSEVVLAMKSAHPYEEPAFGVIKLEHY